MGVDKGGGQSQGVVLVPDPKSTYEGVFINDRPRERRRTVYGQEEGRRVDRLCVRDGGRNMGGIVRDGGRSMGGKKVDGWTEDGKWAGGR